MGGTVMTPERALSISRIVTVVNHVIMLVLFFAVWFDENHFHNPKWHIHAKFHLLWKFLLVVAFVGGADFWVMWVHWEIEPMRFLVCMVPITVWGSRLLSHIIMHQVFEEDVFPHFAKLMGGDKGLTAEDAVVFLLVVLGCVGLRFSSLAKKSSKQTVGGRARFKQS